MPLPSSSDFLRRALRLAARGRYRTSPNPMVGAVLAHGEEIVASGYHRAVGGPHAEVEAFRRAGERAAGATLYVTLEPCCHFGRTPPCVDAILAARVARVVACHRDPNPQVGGQGFAALAAAGVEVEVGELAAEAARLNWRYLAATAYQRPAVTLKWAMSLDGKIATAAGESRWISGEKARRWTMALREEHDAVLVGSGTVLADDPRLDRRLGLARKPNLRVVLDRRLRMKPEARLFAGEGPLLVYTEQAAGSASAALARAGAGVMQLARVEPAAVLADLFQRGIRSLLVEGGGEVAAGFVAAGLFDRVTAVFAPVLVAGRTAPTPLGGEGTAALAAAPRLSDLEVRRLGPDLVVSGFRERCLPELFSSVGL